MPLRGDEALAGHLGQAVMVVRKRFDIMPCPSVPKDDAFTILTSIQIESRLEWVERAPVAVFGVSNPQGFDCALSSLFGFDCRSIGSQTVNVEPSPTTLSTDIRPPCRATSA